MASRVVFAVSAALLLAAGFLGAQSAGSFSLAVVRDGDSPIYEEVQKRMLEELETLTLQERRYTLVRKPDFNAQWDAGRVRSALEAALADPEVDIVVTMGLRSLLAAADPSLELGKPVVALSAVDPMLVSLPLDERNRPSKANLGLMLLPSTLENDFRDIRRMGTFERTIVILPEEWLPHLDRLDDWIARREQEFGSRVDVRGYGTVPADTVAALDTDDAFVYYGWAPRYSSAQILELIDQVNRQGNPTYAGPGQAWVEAGALAGSLPKRLTAAGRRLALNVDHMARGDAAADVSAFLPDSTEQLFFNLSTARQIGYEPPSDLIRYAVLVQGEEVYELVQLDLAGAAEIAIRNNLDVLIQQQLTVEARARSRQTRSELLPQLEANAAYTGIDEDRASSGFQAERRTTAGLSVNQVIYSDELISGYRASDRQAEAALLVEETARLDIVSAASRAYLDFLRARSVLGIARDNLEITQRNLELARLREQVGFSGPQDVYRFETQEASDQSQVSVAQARLERARLQLNRVMGVDLAQQWLVEDISLDSAQLSVSTGPLRELVSSGKRFDRLSQFLIREAFQRAPEVAAAEEQVDASGILYRQSRRSFLMPTVGAQFNYDYIIDESYQGGDPLFETSDEEWSFGVSASLPIFEGGQRVYTVLERKARVRRAQYGVQQARQLVEDRLRSALYAVGSSGPNIEFTARAADRAEKNLRIVTDKYEQGAANIIDLLDAQNQAFVQRQNAAIAVYDFLGDVLEIQRAIARFEFLETEEANEAWVSDIRDYLEAVVPVSRESE